MVEHLLAKEGVEGSNPFFRSNNPLELERQYDTIQRRQADSYISY